MIYKLSAFKFLAVYFVFNVTLLSSVLAVRYKPIEIVNNLFQRDKTTIKRYLSSNTHEMKDIITSDIAKKLIIEQFPQWANLPISPVATSGWDNRTFHLGKKMLLRFPSAQQYALQVEKEQKWLPYLSSQLPLKIPTPLKIGKPGQGFAWHWSVYDWIEGETAANNSQLDKSKLATKLSHFLKNLHKIDTKDGPQPGQHNYLRGDSVVLYQNETLKALEVLSTQLDTKICRKIWDSGARTKWHKSPVWVHGDISPGNLIIENNNLKAVIDFGLLSVGDPACDLAISWTFFDELSRAIFREQIALDDDTWKRGRSWAFWKALIIAAGLCKSNIIESKLANKVLKEIIEDFKING